MLVMAGPDEGDGLRQQLEATAAQMGLNGRVLFTGPLYGDDKWAAPGLGCFCFALAEREFRQHSRGSGSCRNSGAGDGSLRIAPVVDRRAGLVVPTMRPRWRRDSRGFWTMPELAARLREGCRGVADSLSWAEPLAQMETLYRQVILERRES